MISQIPRVSVIMPCYNQGQYLDEAIESVLAQTDQDFEIIVIDDGSTEDRTLQALQKYERSSVKVLHTANRGPAAARNLGIQHAQGQYLLPLDADDRIASTFLEKTVPLLDRHPNLGIVYTQAELFGEQTGRFDLPPYSFPEILLGNMIFNTSLYRKMDWEKTGGYNENMVWGWEDYDFWLSILELGRDVVQIPEVLYSHREVPKSRSQQMTEADWVKSYGQIFHNHSTLYINHIQVLFEHLQTLRNDVHQTHHRLHTTQLALHATQLQLDSAQLRLNQVVDRVQNSKFWQARKFWFRLQKQLGRTVDLGDELLN
ncbi:MAG: glycosyltransferase family A protein [Leptolyngbyaceae cyanobacterium bins.349]|nr:glycosyltransferase family A protein [Leptolyngbyaceae cyanobacterium bins.349]